MNHLWRLCGLCGLCGLCWLAGCAEPESTYTPSPVYEATIEVLSEPPGANIEVNQDYIGKAPCTVTVRAYKGCTTFCKDYTVRALPVIAGQQVQRKDFRDYDSIPKRIFFDMQLVTVPSKLDINVSAEE